MSAFFNTMLLKPSLSPSLNTLVQWLDANDPAGTGVLPNNGSALSSWFDKSGNSNTATQVSGGAQPIFNTNQLNSRPGITFNRSAYMGSPSNSFPFGSTGRTVFIVFNSTTTDVNYLWTYGTSVVNGIYGMTTYNLPPKSYINDLGGAGIQWRSLVSATNYIIETNYPAGQVVGNTVVTVNGSIVSTSINVANLVPNTLSGNAVIGAYVDNSAQFVGNIYEILVYSSALTALQEAQTYNYLHAKWGI